MINKIKKIFLLNQTLSQIIFKNTSWVLMANILAKIFKLALMIFIARSLGPSGFGDANYIIVLSALCFSFSDIGLTMLVCREYQANTSDIQELVATGWLIKILLVMTNTIIGIICILFLPFNLKIPFTIFCLMNVIDNLKQYNIMLARANFKQEYESLCFIIETLLTSGLGIILVWSFGNITSLAIAYLIGSMVAAIYIWLKTKKYTEPISKANKAKLKTLLLNMLPFSLSIFLGMALTSIDTIMIKWLIGSEGVGYYHSGNKLTETILIIPAIFGSSIFPFVAKFYQNSERLLVITKKSINVMSLIGFPIFFGGILLGDQILITIYSTTFSQGILTFKILIASTFPLFLVHILNNVLLATKHEKLCVKISSTIFVTNIIFNLILIPSFGISGAATGTLISRTLLLIILIYFIQKLFKDQKLFQKRTLTYLLLSIVMISIVFLGQLYFTNIILLIGIGGLSYMIALITIQDPYIIKIKSFFSKK
ncbi:MAG: flippase [Candidatus Margulisiibacteriota bacterium]